MASKRPTTRKKGGTPGPGGGKKGGAKKSGAKKRGVTRKAGK